eukprot:TRINITY_DN13609_c0_g2_i1.p1 TRINITY_DN13609_c0_g2~~TRINITY_DN13609_c0_g2_i1.p1  ORF type:complete len:123 (+),score=6.52 TRINITY_DN13609_c0_g2_i1:102-470(+)
MKTLPSVYLEQREALEVRAEIEAMKRVAGHMNIVTLHELFEEENAVHLILDLCSGGDLYDYFIESRGRPESMTAFIFWCDWELPTSNLKTNKVPVALGFYCSMAHFYLRLSLRIVRHNLTLP